MRKKSRFAKATCYAAAAWLLFGLLWHTSLWALSYPSTLMGVVVDASNNSLPCQNAVVVFDPFVNGNTGTASNAQGQYLFENFTALSPAPPHQLAVYKANYALYFNLLFVPPFVEGGTNTRNVSLYLGGSVAGRVMDFKSGEGIANVRVVVSYPGIRDLVLGVTGTAVDGTYTLEHIYPGAQDLWVSHPWYASPGNRTLPFADQVLLPNQNFRLRPGGGLAGLVTDFSGTPLGALGNPSLSAHLKLSPSNGDANNIFETYANSQGAYAFSNVLTGSYILQVSPPYNQNLQTEETSNINIIQGSVTTHNYTLQPGGYLQGKVLLHDQSPAVGFALLLCTDAKYPFEAEAYALTSASGDYSFAGLSPQQSYTAMVVPENNTVQAIALASHLSVVENQTTFWDVTLGLGGGRTGTILNPQGMPLYPGKVIALNNQIGLPKDLTPSSTEYSLLNLPEGDYFIGVGPGSGNTQSAYSTAHITPGRVETYSLQLQPGGILQGYVTGTAGEALPGVKISAKDPWHPFSGSAEFELAAFTDDSGYFKLEGLSTTTYTIEVKPELADHDGYAPQTLLGYSMTAGMTQFHSFELSQDGIKLQGTVRDQTGNRIMNALVHFWLPGTAAEQSTAVTSQWGNYSLMLKPGSYQAQIYYLNLLGANLASLPRTVTFSSDDFFSQFQDFTVQTGASWSGRVQDSLGRPVPLTQLRAFCSDTQLPCLTALSSPLGNFQLNGLASNSYVLDLQADGYAPLQTVVTPLIGNRYLDQVYILIAQQSIAGRVTRNQQPLEHAVVQLFDATNSLVLQTTTSRDGNYLAEPLSYAPYTLKVTAVGLKSQSQTTIYPGHRADFELAALLGKDEALSFPNPCRGQTLQFLYWMENEGQALIRVYNQLGELVWDWEGQGVGGAYNQHAWNVSGVAPGVYLYKIKLRTNQGTETLLPTGKLTIIK